MILAGRSSRWRLRRAGLASILALVLVITIVSTASAHANLIRSDPTAGSSLASAPSRVQLWFSEDVEPSFSAAVIYDAKSQRVDLGDSHVAPDDARSIIVGVKPGLPPGTYVVAWKTQSRQDGHIVRGTIPFGVGVSVVPSDAAIAEPAPGPVS
ncbi:MAG TPA: copper resistance protein CopC, partial [Chloroflexota bacterium]|nr:copper resistance protein CopC [Chloroflexota bacterium]